ncbi:GGDEF domain-containing protein [Oceanospirillum linum]|nr:sensor domain-containing diguanylate cyclase [Oceanospirillum linum]SEG49471.1 diguanylate cyclase (GGDEF) domain-containing protein [Oleiphilus messinensis]SMP22753.1 diguanylate cyclase (GGDEF) domain-containing protein [Oceanospirillum linum]
MIKIIAKLAPQLVPKDQHQRLRMRRTLMATGSGLVLTAVVLLSMALDLVQMPMAYFFLLYTMIWLGNLCFPLMISYDINLLFKDPSLTIPQLIWHTFTNTISIYLVPELQNVFLMYYLLVVLFGAFRMQKRGFFIVGGFILLCYTTVMLVHQLSGAGAEIKEQSLISLFFIFMLVGVSIIGTEISSLRWALKKRNAEMNEVMKQAKEQAITDDLTGLYNRRHLMAILRHQQALAYRGEYVFSLCFVDLDHFKQVNDRYGHKAGDEVLQTFADIARNCVREVDFVARLGGEEFVLVLVQTPLEGACLVAERLRLSMEQARLDILAPGHRVTASIGVTQYRPKESIEETMHRADIAVYSAKNRGRNQLVSDHELEHY